MNAPRSGLLIPVVLCLLTFARAGIERAADAPPPSKPNILLIVSDDQGYADTGFNGCQDIPTPHLDRLAKSGVRFTSGYVTHAFCSPSRAALMTGRYQQRFGHEFNPVYDPLDPKEGLPLTEKLLPEFLQKAGYATGWIGKWHLGASPAHTPQRRGFAETFGFIGGGHQFWNWKPNERQYTLPIERNGRPVEVTHHLTTEFGDEAGAFVKRHAHGPWFLYLAFNAPHQPNQPTPERLARFAHLKAPNRATYAAQVSLMDDAIGTVMDAVRQSGQESRTLVFFFSDNGGPITKGAPNGAQNTPLRGGKGDLYEGGVRVPFVASWPGRLPFGQDYAPPVSSLDVLATALACAGVPVPTDRKYDGVDLVPFLTGEKKGAPHEHLFWRYGVDQQWAMREGDWKLVRLKGQPDELYDLAADIAEAQNLAAAKPEVAHRLAARLEAWDKELMPPAFLGSSVKPEDWGPGGANQRNLSKPQPRRDGSAAPAKPNIILILADDRGYADPACFGGTATRTPHLDALARSGTRMTRYYAASAVCTPTRASIMTGRFPLRFDIRRHFPDDESHLPRGVVTLPSLLHDAGYATAHVGKWHLGGLQLAHAKDRAHAIPGPREQGFEHYLCQNEEQPLRGELGQKRRLYRDGGTCLLRDDQPVPPNDPYFRRHFTDIIGDEAIRLVEQYHKEKRPFFLNLWHLVPHEPMEPGSEPHFRNTAATGISEDQHCFRSMVAHLDSTIGALLAKLDQLGIRENTLIVFTSDNGGAREADNGPLKGGKTDLHEGGIRVPMIASWPKGIPAGKTSDAVAGSADLLPTFCAAAGAPVPDSAQVDGVNLLPHLIEGRDLRNRPALMWQLDLYPSMQRRDPKPKPYATEAAMDGHWKLLARDGQPLELFDLQADVGETHNLLEQHPDIAAKLAGEIRSFLKSPRDRSGFKDAPASASSKQASESGAVETKPPRLAAADKWRALRVGLFIHWGPSSGKALPQSHSHARKSALNPHGSVPAEVYDRLYQEFNPTNYHPDAWLKLAHDAGMRYAVFVAKHHDGFCMFKSAATDYSIMATPYGQDVAALFAAACRRQGLALGWQISPKEVPADHTKAPEAAFRDVDYEIPAQYTRGKSEITIRIEHVHGWPENSSNEYHYWIYCYGRTPVPAQPLLELGPMSAVHTHESAVELGWVENTDGVGRVRIQRRAEGEIAFKTIGTVAAGTTVFQDTTFPPFARCAYRIQAFNEVVESEPSLEVVILTPAGPGLPNLARGAKASASSSRGKKFTPDMAIDGRHRSQWSSASGAVQEWLELDLGRESEVAAVILFQDSGGTRISAYAIQAMVKGQWKDVYGGLEMPDAAVCRFDPVVTSRVRLLVKSARGENPGIREMCVFGKTSKD